MADRKPRATQWDATDASDGLNPLGQRILFAFRNWRKIETDKGRPDKGAAGFSFVALGVASRIHTHLVRLKTPEYRLDVKSLVGYAKAGEVSLFWLVTGDGSPFDGAFAEPVASDIGGLPEALQRGLRAAVIVLGCSTQTAVKAAYKAWQAYPAEARSAEAWQAIVTVLVREAPGESGERPSARMRPV